MALVGRENYPRGAAPTKSDWFRGVERLREMGYSIRYYIPSTNTPGFDGEKTPLWALRKAAVALDVLPERAFITREGDGGTYKDFPGPATREKVFRALEEHGIEHGWDV